MSERTTPTSGRDGHAAQAALQAPRNLSAALLAMGSTGILSFVDNFVGAVAETHGLWQFQVLRALIALPLLWLGARLLRQRLRPFSLPRLAARSGAVAVGLLIYFSALGTLSVAQAGAGLFSAPIWVLVLSAVLFRAPVTWPRAVAIVAGFAGALMLLQPDLSGLSALSLLPLGAGVFYGLGMLLTRFWCGGESALALTLGIFVAIGGLSALALLGIELGAGGGDDFLTRGWAPLTWRFFWLTVLQAVGAIVAVSLIAQAYRTGSPSFVAVFEYSFLIFAALWTWLLWGQGSNLLAWAGIGVIIASGLAMNLSERGPPARAQRDM